MVDRPPEVDDLEALREESGHVLRGEVAVDAGDGRVLGLVNVHLWHGLALLRGVLELARAAAADR